ncbi:hypothetical protein VPH35_058086 [Triticum aestivum]|uniref:Uncharacterized protein n=1 Tax=Aegilops tauschii subsp. strangulata TaxID=200361 RepID=A0A453E019_AEGTS
MKTRDASACILLVQASDILAADGVRRHPGPILRILYSDARWQLCKTCTLKIVLRSRRVQSFRPAREEELGRLLRSVVAALASSSSENLTSHTSACVAYSMVASSAPAWRRWPRLRRRTSLITHPRASHTPWCAPSPAPVQAEGVWETYLRMPQRGAEERREPGQALGLGGTSEHMPVVSIHDGGFASCHAVHVRAHHV